ncbi:MAG: hypothetical protein LUP99_01000 [Methanomicrobiales archaeon]|nr:hypothetical protein [Methanomicrobiales archaeon]
MILIKSAFWMVLAAFLCCCACACLTAGPSENQTSGGPSVIDKTPRDEPANVTFENAWQKLSYYESTGALNLTGVTIHQIYGTGVDARGNASSWIVGVQQGNTSSLLVYDRESWRQVSWGESFTSPYITFDQILLPTEIYDTNSQTIENTMNANGVKDSDIDLSDGVYTISIRSSNGLSQLRYNATTGELLS